MDDDKYINSITLEYLLNPSLYEKINQRNMNNNFIYKDIKFYRKRICQITKDMCKGDYINDNFKTLFLNYANTIIYHLKQLDEKDILQEEYKELFEISGCNLELNNSNLNSDISKEFNMNDINHTNDASGISTIDNILINKPTITNTLDHFVKKINLNNEEKFLPKRRVANIKNPVLKNKGVKKKIS